MNLDQILNVLQNTYIAYIITIDKNQNYNAIFLTPNQKHYLNKKYIDEISQALNAIIDAELEQNTPPVLNAWISQLEIVISPN